MAGRVVHHQLDVYGAWIHVTRSRKAMRAMRKTYGVKIPKKLEVLGLTAHASDRDGSMHFAVFLDKQLDGAGLIEIVAHESAHLAGMLLDSIEAEYDGRSEPFAYLVGWATSWLWQVALGLENPAS